MKNLLNIFFFYLLLLICISCNASLKTETYLIEIPVPQRPAGQSDVIALTAPKLDTVRTGFIGLGMRAKCRKQIYSYSRSQNYSSL